MDVREKSSNEKRLIDANKTMNGVVDLLELGWGYEGIREDVQQIFENAETVDAVTVVRCRECKQGEIDDPDFPDQYYCHAGCGWNNGLFYCAYGERKDGAG